MASWLGSGKRSAGPRLAVTVFGLLVMLALGLPMATAGGSVGATEVVPRFERAHCPIPFPASFHAQCGALIALENREQPTGRTVRLPVAILRSEAADPKPDPFVFVTGGPAFNEIDRFGAEFMSELAFPSGRDVILYNQRGVGFAEPRLGCHEFDDVRAATFPAGPTPQDYLDAVQACRDRLAGEGIDLSAYNAAEDAADLNDLRLVLGYDTWNLYVLSAGGVIGLDSMRLYPEGLRSVVLDSAISSTWRLRGPDIWAAPDRTLDLAFEGCLSNPACASAYPRLRSRFLARLDVVRRHPVTIDIPIEGGGTYPLLVTGEGLIQEVAYCAGDPFCAPGVPGLADRIAQGDLASVFEGWVLSPDPPNDPVLSEGKAGAYRCHDSIAFEPDSELREAALALPEWRQHLLTLDWIYVPTLTREACQIWQVGKANPAEHQSVVSSVPTLVLSGKWDATVSPAEAHRIASTLSRSFLYEFPGIAHFTISWGLFGDSDCPVVITKEFLAAPTTRPDSSCIATMPDVDFTPGAASRPLGARPAWMAAAG